MEIEMIEIDFSSFGPSPIPKVVKSRMCLRDLNNDEVYCYLNSMNDGNKLLVMSKNTFPDIFNITNPNIWFRSPVGWKQTQSGNMKQLWFPKDNLRESDINVINDWIKRFSQYILLGKNRHIEGIFEEELDFCMAASMNRLKPDDKDRTALGEAEYQSLSVILCKSKNWLY